MSLKRRIYINQREKRGLRRVIREREQIELGVIGDRCWYCQGSFSVPGYETVDDRKFHLAGSKKMFEKIGQTQLREFFPNGRVS